MVTLVVGRERLSVPKWVTNLGAFRRWLDTDDLPEHTRAWFLRGEVWIDMSKEQLYTHADLKAEITGVLRTLAKADKLGRCFPDGVLLTNRKADLSGNPDAVFVSFESLNAKRVTLVEGKEGGFVELLGTPDMVLEVVSDSSERKDNQTLFEAYYDAGIAEYWLVDARGSEIEFHVYKRGAKRYSVVKKQPGGWVKSPVFGKSFRLARGTDATGNPEFTLEVK
jgi:Uma2 family endonuclease